MSRISGNTDSVKKNILEYMETFCDKAVEPESFIPGSLVIMMTFVTLVTGHEVAVLLDRKNRVSQITIGDSNTVELSEADKRRGNSRLCGLRLIHTHPNGTVTPSSIDINSLKSMRYDAMCVVGVRPPTGFTPAIPQEDDYSLAAFVSGISCSVFTIRDKKSVNVSSEDSLGYELVGPEIFRKRNRFDGLFEYIALYDKNVVPDYSTEEKSKERALAVGVITPTSGYDFGGYDETLSELCELAKTAGAEVVGVFTQRKEAPDSRYYIGKGLAEDLSLQRQALNASLIIFDDELSSSQINNLENITGAKVIDRTALVLDIFAMRANSKEGRLQVELAQQKYRLPRIMGQGHSLSRLGGGIGTRGPGETKLQTDRRHIQRRIEFLEAQLDEVTRKRSVLRAQRKKNEFPSVAIVGYTNAGKSSLQNALCNSDSFCENELFATLDPAVRKMTVEDDRTFLLTDTVGFIRKLPHDLVNAFKSTLEETVFADLLLVVADCSSPECENHINTVCKILEEIGADGKPAYLVLNKCDVPESVNYLPSPDLRKTFGKTFTVSAKSGLGLSELRDGIREYFTRTEKQYIFTIPYVDSSFASFIHENGKIYSQDFTDTGCVINASLPDNLLGKVKRFITGEVKK